MNKNRILSSALVAIMLLMAIVPIIPIKSEAAYSSQLSENIKYDSIATQVVNNYMSGAFSSAEEMFQYDWENGYLEYSTNGVYTVYVNEYTGVMYYRNNVTGEMLTSNSYNLSEASGEFLEQLASQITLVFSRVETTNKDETYYSSIWAALRNQITVTHINGGLRVNYALGNTSVRELVPLAIEASAFEEKLLRPMMDVLEAKAAEVFGSGVVLNFFDSSYYKPKKIEKDDMLHYQYVDKYLKEVNNTYIKPLVDPDSFSDEEKAEFVDAVTKIDMGKEDVAEKVFELQTIYNNVRTILTLYFPIHANSANDENSKKYIDQFGLSALTEEGKSLYCAQKIEPADLAGPAKIIKSICPNYTFDEMYADEAACGYVVQKTVEPVFRLSLEYVINSDGTLSISLPSSSIVFDETRYILKSVTPLQYFGAASFQNDGYIFVPDGSGSIIEFEDFEQSTVTMSLNPYGQDYCYSTVQGSAYGQQVTVPVYGIVSESSAGNGIDTGYFAIVEEGASMANIKVEYQSSMFNEGTVYTTFAPYPIDQFDLSDTLSVGNSDSYSMVAESRYTGSYTTRYTMLSANPNNVLSNGHRYSPNYVGMVNCYRDYLESNGVLTELAATNDDLPLYIEALGSIEVVEKFLTFPITVSKAITSFDDVSTMYEELKNSQATAKAKLAAKAQEYATMAAECQTLIDGISKELESAALEQSERNALEKSMEKYTRSKEEYLKKSADYERLSAEAVSIDNINFKLTGFANGGMDFTYPAKVKWERSLGGKRDFKKLIKVAQENTDSDSTFGLYPDFDFQYVNNTKLFDGIGKRNTLSKMVDNRYASKQAYSNITGKFDSIYAMIVSPDALDRLYSKFLKKYDNYKITGISVSTLGSDLNSNFDKKNPISRDEAQGYVTDLLGRIANDYSVMISKGNIYAVEHADHILDVATDASYYRYSSYAVPFLGMIFHGYVNYTGSAFNYSGSPDYDLLRSIESGASLYYILGYQNSELMKEDEDLNKYFSISYENWFEDILENYTRINAEIGDLQNYKIVDHQVLIGERVIEESERKANLEALKTEFLSVVEKTIDDAINAAYDDMFGDSAFNGMGINLTVDAEGLKNYANERLNLEGQEALGADFVAKIQSIESKYKDEHGTDDAGYVISINADTIRDYKSEYKYVTDGIATGKVGKDYERTDYTVDNDLIVMVTYKNSEGKTRTFILNYNIYDVEIILENGAEPITISKYGFHRIDG